MVYLEGWQFGCSVISIVIGETRELREAFLEEAVCQLAWNEEH